VRLARAPGSSFRAIVARALHDLHVTMGFARKWSMGAELVGGAVHFRVWAPGQREVSLLIETASPRELAMTSDGDGFFSLHVDGARAGTRYRYRLGDGHLYADPASRFQPEGPFGPSQVIDPADWQWTDQRWPGIPEPHTQVIYELHVGTFTPEGTYAAAANALPYLRDVGITTLEMMPVNGFPGTRGWGYDGVNLFAPYHPYGTPAELRAFIDRAHAVGLAVILDVVYNHFGPAGNSLYQFAPELKSEQRNEWGDMLDFSRRGVRDFFIANASYWIEEFHFDGLRIDATQAIVDDGECHILREITDAARAAAATRRVFIVGENEPQDVHLVAPREQGGCGLDALWNDDFHHTTRVALTGCTDGYFHDYAGTPQELVSALERGFLYQGQLYAWQRNTRGTPTQGLPPGRFVHFLENHDQVANLGFGDRLSAQTDPASLRAMTALLLLGPQIPMLFQGQEAATRTPFRFFCDHDERLNELVRQGRAEFLSQFARLATPDVQPRLPDPSATSTFAACVLDPAERDLDAPMVQLHRDLIRLRRSVPCFTDQSPGTMRGAVLGTDALCLRWCHPDGDRLLLVNLGKTIRRDVIPEPLLAPPLSSGWRVEWSSEHPAYGGRGTPEPFTRKRLAVPARSAVLCAPDPAHNLRVDTPPSGEKGLVEP
jgi:maltooligosyltrehalose trehalohydrolase